MRELITSSENKQRELVDGVRIFEEGGWVLVAPDRQAAAFQIMAESSTDDGADRLVKRYRELVEVSQQD